MQNKQETKHIFVYIQRTSDFYRNHIDFRIKSDYNKNINKLYANKVQKIHLLKNKFSKEKNVSIVSVSTYIIQHMIFFVK